MATPKRITTRRLRLIVMVGLVAGLGLQRDFVISANTTCVQSTCIALPFVSVPQPLAASGQYGFRDRTGNVHLQGQVVNQSNFPIAGYVQYDKVYPPYASAEYLLPGMALTHTFYINDIVYSPPNTPNRWVVAAQGTLDH